MNPDDAVAETATFIDDEARDRLTVAGADALTYLQSQLAQEIRDMAVGSARWSFVLEPTGKAAAFARVTRTGDESFVLDTDAGFGESMMARVNRFKIRVAVETELVLAAVAEPSPQHEAARIAGGWPRMGAEIEAGSTIPATTGVVVQAVSFTKGCYPGQELVERMDSRGADAPKTLRIIDLVDGQAVGSPVTGDDGAEVGAITSIDAATNLGLAYVKRGADVGRIPAHLS